MIYIPPTSSSPWIPHFFNPTILALEPLGYSTETDLRSLLSDTQQSTIPNSLLFLFFIFRLPSIWWTIKSYYSTMKPLVAPRAPSPLAHILPIWPHPYHFLMRLQDNLSPSMFGCPIGLCLLCWHSDSIPRALHPWASFCRRCPMYVGLSLPNYFLLPKLIVFLMNFTSVRLSAECH